MFANMENSGLYLFTAPRARRRSHGGRPFLQAFRHRHEGSRPRAREDPAHAGFQPGRRQHHHPAARQDPLPAPEQSQQAPDDLHQAQGVDHRRQDTYLLLDLLLSKKAFVYILLGVTMLSAFIVFVFFYKKIIAPYNMILFVLFSFAICITSFVKNCLLKSDTNI